MLDGQWLVQFHSPSTGDCRAGIIVFLGTQVMGGDSVYYYSGSYSAIDQDANVKIRIRKHSPGLSVFGHLADFYLLLRGKLAENVMLLEGYLEHRELRLQVKLSKLD